MVMMPFSSTPSVTLPLERLTFLTVEFTRVRSVTASCSSLSKARPSSRLKIQPSEVYSAYPRPFSMAVTVEFVMTSVDLPTSAETSPLEVSPYLTTPPV